MSRTSHSSPLRLAATLGVICLLTTTFLTLGAGSSIAGGKATKLERQIDVMEGAIDDMLVDSPNFLVAGRHVTEGFDIDDYGVLFSFKASLTVGERSSDSWFYSLHYKVGPVPGQWYDGTGEHLPVGAIPLDQPAAKPAGGQLIVEGVCQIDRFDQLGVLDHA